MPMIQKNIMADFLPPARLNSTATNQNTTELKNIERTQEMDHKCDMFCLWEDLHYTYEKCVNCCYNSVSIKRYLDNRVNTGLPNDNDHLWRKHNNLNYKEYVEYLKNLREA